MNLPFAERPHVFVGDECLASALIERLTQRVHVIDIRGESYRLQASLKARKGCGIAKMATT
jgi:DNA replication protein DnaC